MRMIGTINGRVLTKGRFGRKAFNHDGTTLGMIKSAVAAGAKVGDTIWFDRDMRFVLCAAAHDGRANGVWADRVWK